MMKPGRLASCGTLAALLFAGAASAVPPPLIPDTPPGATTYTREQLEAMPPQDLARLLFGDYAKGFIEKRTSDGIGFYTAPRMAAAGVCSVQRLTILMAPDPKSGRVYTAGLVVKELYHLVDLPGPFEPNSSMSINATRALCEALPPGTLYFPAPSARTITYQHHLIAEAVAQAKTSGRLSFKLRCMQGEDCEARTVLAAINPSAIRSIVARDCDGLSRHDCYEIDMGAWYLEVESGLSNTYSTSPVEPDRVLISIGVRKLPHYLAFGCTDCSRPH